MKRLAAPVACVVATLLLAACAGTPATPAPKPTPAPAPPPIIQSGYKLQPVYLIKFDAQHVARSADGKPVTRESVIDLLATNSIDRKTVIHIEVPKGITYRDESIAAFSRAQQVAKIFNLLGFESVLVALAK